MIIEIYHQHLFLDIKNYFIVNQFIPMEDYRITRTGYGFDSPFVVTLISEKAIKHGPYLLLRFG